MKLDEIFGIFDKKPAPKKKSAAEINRLVTTKPGFINATPDSPDFKQKNKEAGVTRAQDRDDRTNDWTFG